MTAMASLRKARAAALIQQECDRIVARLAVHGTKTRAVTQVVKRLLLNAPYFYDGARIDPKARSLGAGVWEISNGEDERRGGE